MPNKKTTRAAQGSGSIRKKVVERNGKPYEFWEARVTIGRDPGTGKQIQKSFTGKTQKEVREKMQTAAVAVNQHDYFEPSTMTVSRWIDIWLDEYTGDKKYSTVRQYRAECNNHIKPALGAVKLSELTTPQIQSFYNGKIRSGLSAKTVRNIHGILEKCLNVAVQVNYIRHNPAAVVILPKIVKKELHPLTDNQVSDFLNAATGTEYEYLLKMIVFTGLRKSEATGLTWDCVDFDAGTLKICKQLQKRPVEDGGYTFAPLKNNKTRIIKPAPFVMRLLKDRYKQQTEERFKAGECWTGWQSIKERNTALVFTTPMGGHVAPNMVHYHYKKIAKKIGVPESRVHDLRHTYAVLSLQNGDDVKTVQTNLGHASAAFTLDVYGHVSEKMKDDSAQRMERYITSITG